MTTPDTPSYWDKLKPGDLISLRDEETLTDMMTSGSLRASGLDLTVKEISTIEEAQGLMKWILITLEPVTLDDTQQVWYVFVKIVDDAVDIRVMYSPEDFEDNTREGLLEHDCFWLFQEPEDPDDFEPKDLLFTESIGQDIEGEDGKKFFYDQKRQGVLYGRMQTKPRPSGVDEPQFVTIIEFATDYDGCNNPEILLLEIGGVVMPDYSECESEEEAEFIEEQADAQSGGGYVMLLQGANINPTDIEIMSVKVN